MLSKILSFSLQHTLFAATWVGLLMAHVRLCYPAMIDRGYPPLMPEHFMSLFIAPLFVWLPSVFAERRTRSFGVTVGAVGFTLIYALVQTNLESARPHIGHTHGVFGMLQAQWLTLVMRIGILYVPMAITLYFLERVLGDTLGLRLRHLMSQNHGMHTSRGG